jgi:DNA topoisomerase IB
VLALNRRRGNERDELLAYRPGRGRWVDITSGEINDRVKDLLGEEYSAKDFRTWNGTVLAASGLARRAASEDREAAVRETIAEVAEILGNTPAVARASYVDPRVIERYERGKTIRAALDRVAKAAGRNGFADREQIERAVIRLLRSAPAG